MRLTASLETCLISGSWRIKRRIRANGKVRVEDEEEDVEEEPEEEREDEEDEEDEDV